MGLTYNFLLMLYPLHSLYYVPPPSHQDSSLSIFLPNLQSAGGHLALLTAYHLLKAQPSHTLSGLLLHFGAYDLSLLPAARNRTQLPVLNCTAMRNFINAFCPAMDAEALKHPSVSPYYEDLEKWRGRLPSALFTCGTSDCLLDDTVAMATKWLMGGGEAVVRFYEGAPHGFIHFSEEASDGAREGRMDVIEYIGDRLVSMGGDRIGVR
jgi:acetyl esterase/lipase